MIKGLGQASEHDADHGEANEGRNGRGVAFEVTRQAAVAADPRERALDNPSLGKTTKLCALLRLTICKVQQPVSATTCSIFGPW